MGDMSSRNDALKLKEDLRSRGVRGIALDIDETLAYSNEYWFEHMFKFHAPPPERREEIIRSQKFAEDVPEWGTPEARQYIHDTIHSNEFQEKLPLVEGADAAVQTIHSSVPIVAYITARPDSVRQGTLNWLAKHGFPEAELIMREEPVNIATLGTDKNFWKAGVLKALHPEVLGIVDDNLGLAHELEGNGYEGTLYLYGPQKEEFAGHPRVVVCPTWHDVVAGIKTAQSA